MKTPTDKFMHTVEEEKQNPFCQARLSSFKPTTGNAESLENREIDWLIFQPVFNAPSDN